MQGCNKGDDIHYIDHLLLPSANNMVQLATEKFQQNLFEDVALLNPLFERILPPTSK